MVEKTCKVTKTVEDKVMSLDIAKLFDGKVFKNHRVMCEEFGWKYKDSTDSKKAQLKVLSQYCEWHKQGHKIIVDQVFNTKKAKIDKRNIFSKTIESDVIEELFHHTRANQNEPMIISKGGLMRKIELFNRNCYEARCNISAFAKRYMLDEKQVEDILNLNYRSGSDNEKSTG